MMESGRRLDLSATPRSVPLLVRFRLLFGGILNQGGWLFFGFGMVFFWAFVLRSDPAEWLEFRADLDTTQGTLVAIEETNASEGDISIVACRYTFEVDGVVHDGVSYGSGGSGPLLEPGQRVTVEFPAGRPGRSRIAGMRTAVFTPVVLIAAIFPLVGLVLLLNGLARGRRAVRLLANGELRLGTLKAKEMTNIRVNKRPVYKLTFEFKDDRMQTREVSALTPDPGVLEDEAEEPLLFDPFVPGEATMLDHLPGHPRIDEHGEIQAGSPFAGVAVMILPLLTVAGHGYYVYRAFLAG